MNPKVKTRIWKKEKSFLESVQEGKISKETPYKLLSKSQPNLNTMVGFYTKITLQPPTPTTTHPHKLIVCNISAVTDLILMKL